MRSRFLNADYFADAQSHFETLEDLDFFNLSPPPPLSPPNRQLELDLPFSDLHSDVSSDIDRLPFASALSDFLSDVIPQFIPEEIANEEQNFEDSKSGAHEGSLDPSNGKGFGSGTSEIRITEESEWGKELQFEILEMDFPLRECMSSRDVEDAALYFEIPCIRIPLDTINIEMEVTVTYPHEIVKSICAVEVIPDVLSVKDEQSPSNKVSDYTVVIPEFEVSELGFGLEGPPAIEEAFTALLPCVESSLVINAKEILGSTNLDIMEHVSMNASSEQCPVDEPLSVNSVLEMNVLDLNGSMVLEKNSAIYPLTAAGDFSSMPCSVYFQEVEILDIPSVHVVDELNTSQAAKAADISDDKMFKDDMDSIGSFYETVVSSELALVDDAFKSLPVPFFPEGEDMKSQSWIFGNVLQILRPHALTAADGLYLDWHPLVEGTCTREICATYICMLHEITCCNVASELTSSENVFHITLDFIDDPPERLNASECRKALFELNGIVPQFSETSNRSAATRSLKDDHRNIQNEKEMPKLNSEKISSLFESMSQSNDLNFFLGARRGTARKICSGETTERGSSKVTSVVFSKEASQPPSLPEVHFLQWDIEVHHVSLTDHIRGLMDNIEKSYLAILNYGTDLRSNTLLIPEDDIKFLSLSKDKLLDTIMEKSKSQFMSGCQDETFMGLLALYVIKQLAYVLCFFGIHAAHLYISNLTREIDNLVIRLRPLESLIEDARRKSERHLVESHPSLSIIESILKSHTWQNGKILIIADRLFWLPLNQKLTSMMIKPYETRYAGEFTYQADASDTGRSTNYILEALVESDCLLISPENISESFPFDKFSIIVEYGGQCSSPRICSTTPKLNAPRVHFLRVNMENDSIYRTFCEGFGAPHHRTLEEGLTRSTPSLQRILSKEHIEELLSFVPIEKASCFSSISENHIDASHEAESSMNMPRSLNSKKTNTCVSSSPDVVIVVNTQNYEKKMLISRRSSYQKILTLEKEGMQVVEREVNLPLDLIFSAAVCLVWYETRHLGDGTMTTSSIPIFIETIATNILMSLSFAFSSCILIFEGASSFLSAIMESSDALYAAAASLDLNLQIFCSYMPESTDEIILSCIKSASKLHKGIFPAMPESETLGESFLTRFPSINPLSAHAILSSGGTLVEFLQWSQKRRIQAIGEYQVPDESIHLFDALCKYGEMGESKSVMTECSSVHSDVSSGKLQPENKRQKYAMSSHSLEVPLDNFFDVEPVNQTENKIMKSPPESSSHRLKDFFNPQDMIKKNKRSQLFHEVLEETRGTSSSEVSNLDGNVTSDHISTFVDGINDGLAKRQKAYASGACDLRSDSKVGWGHLKENFSNEEDMGHNSKFLRKDHSSTPSNISFFREEVPRNEPIGRSDLHESRQAFNLYSHRTFPTSEEINSGNKNWSSTKDRTWTLEEKILGRKASCSNKNGPPAKSLKEKGTFMPRYSRNVLGSVNEIKAPSYVEKTHSKAVQPSRTYHGLQQALESLRSAKDNREVHEQNLTCNTCLSCPGSSRNIGIPCTRQSPSIIDSYRYNGGSQISEKFKSWRKKGQARDRSINAERKDSSSVIPPTWTPVDKRARQNLSFKRSGNEKQSKLVWRNRYSPDSSCILRKRNRDTI